MSKYIIDYSSRYKKDVKKINKKDIKKVDEIINRLASNEVLEEKYHDHKLQGDWIGFRECHVKPNLLLVYKKLDDVLILTAVRLGSHSDLF